MRFATLLALVLLAPTALAQDGGTGSGPIYPDLDGDDLVTALAGTYAPTYTFGYDRARDSLFAAVEMGALDSLRCAYTGVAIWIDPALDPTTAGWNASPRFSTEHVWPQSHGADQDARADLHHLRPVQQSVNSSRGNVPFGETEDAGVDKWYGPDGGYLTAPPPFATRDAYSEKLNGGDAARFEPREDVAGDVARAMFYVYAVYGPLGAGQVDAAFFAEQRRALLDWHAQDPPDADELARTEQIAVWQGSPNPFVLDATLAARAFGAPEPIVALSAFTAEGLTSSQARIEWTTSTETGATTFRIEGRADVFGSEFEPWFAVPAAGQPFAYSVDHGPLAAGAYRIRLVMVDASGEAYELGEIDVTVPQPVSAEQAPASDWISPAWPNPAASRVQLTLRLPSPVHVRAVVVDALGRQVLVAHDGQARGAFTVAADVAALPPGVYALTVAAGSKTAVVRFTVAR